jgi:hypothetical protein
MPGRMKQTTMKALYTALLATVIVGLVAAGCGDSGSSDPLTKAQFLQEGNSICEDAETERSEALQSAADGDPEVAELATDALPPVEEMTEELSELDGPAGERGEVQAIVDAFNEGVEEVKADPGDPAVAISAFTEANTLAESYGLTDCTI